MAGNIMVGDYVQLTPRYDTHSEKWWWRVIAINDAGGLDCAYIRPNAYRDGEAVIASRPGVNPLLVPAGSVLAYRHPNEAP